MKIQENNPRDIYHNVQNLISDIIGKLNVDSNDSMVKETTKSSHEVLSKLESKINEQLSLLDKYAEWNTFTIALYGETNAGKSTIIETLRLLLGEKTKQNQQQQFRLWEEKSGITLDAIEQKNKPFLI